MDELSQSSDRADANRGPTILAVTWVECALAILIVGTRMYTRSYLIHNVGIDDWMIVLALVLAIICSGLVTADVHYGTGRHFATLDPVEKLMANKLNWIAQPFAIFSCGVGKISIAFLLLRIMAKNKLRERFLYTLIALLVTINAICVGFIFGQCSPARKLWNPSVPGSCLDPSIQQNVGFFQASFSSFSDFVLALFPLVIIWNLKMRRAVKFGIGAAMSLGILATGAAIVKTIQLQQLTARADYTYETVDLVIWYTTESYVVIIAACVPTLRPLLPLLHGRSLSRKSASGSREIYPFARGRGKNGYRAHKDDDGHHLRGLYPPASYRAHGLSADDHRGTQTVCKGKQDTDVESGPQPDPNEIIKTTEVGVSYGENSSQENAPSIAQGHAAVYAENDTYSALR
ncbi:MAG: hypothetical protein Q9188_005250 [Gyalolechia gomerana]